MYHSTKNDIYTHNSSSFVGYTDYTNSSISGFVVPFYHIREITIPKNPNLITLNAILEAEQKENLQSFETIEDFFDDLER